MRLEPADALDRVKGALGGARGGRPPELRTGGSDRRTGQARGGREDSAR